VIVAYAVAPRLYKVCFMGALIAFTLLSVGES